MRLRNPKIHKIAPQPGSDRPCVYVSLEMDGDNRIGVALDLPALANQSPQALRRRLLREAVRQVLRMPEFQNAALTPERRAARALVKRYGLPKPSSHA